MSDGCKEVGLEAVATATATAKAEPKPKAKSKRAAAIEGSGSGRKKALTPAAAARKPPVVATITSDEIIGHLTAPDSRPLIAFLPIQMSDVESDMFGEPAGTTSTLASYIPESNDGVAAISSASSVAELPSVLVTDAPPPGGCTVDAPPVTEQLLRRPALPAYYSEKLLIRFGDANRTQKLPETSDVACFWDCHTFRGPPCVIPIKIEEDIWCVYGNFCCPECAAAYLFSERLGSHVQWERYALLNRLCGETVKLAPSRAVLRLFGGNLDVSEFRALIGDKKLRVDVVMPPMISITQSMDTKPIDFYDASVKNNFIPWAMDRMNRPGAQGLRLRRTKPLVGKDATVTSWFT